MVRNKDGTFPKGVSGNPNGRKKLEVNLDALIDKCVTASDWLDMLSAVKTKAKRGDLKCIEFLFDRRFGKPLQSHEVAGKGGGPITLRVVRDMTGGSRIPDTSTPSAPETSGNKS
jgi:hypothetical protein